MGKTTVILNILFALAFYTAIAQTPKPSKKMFIEEVITRAGVWEANAEASFKFREELYQMGVFEDEANKIITKASDVWFMFREGQMWHYGKTPYSSGMLVFAKYHFIVDEIDETIKMYKDANRTGEVVLTCNVKSVTEERLIFFLEEDEMYFVCDYTTEKRKFPKE